MLGNYRKILREHISGNSVKYFSLLLCFIAGITVGALFVTAMPEDSAAGLAENISAFCNMAQSGSITFSSTLQTSLYNALRMVIMIVIGSFSVYLIPVIYINIMSRGFATGFTVGFFTMHFGGAGLLMAAVSVIPQCFLELPVVLLLCVKCINKAVAGRKSNYFLRGGESKKDSNLRFTYYLVIILIILFAIIAVESLLVNEFSKLISGLILR